MRISDWSSDVCSSDLDVVEIGIEDRRIAVRRNRQLVDIDGDLALETGRIAVGVDAARGEIVEILRRPVDDDAGRILGDALETRDTEGGEFLMPECPYAERHVLQPRVSSVQVAAHVFIGPGTRHSFA